MNPIWGCSGQRSNGHKINVDSQMVWLRQCAQNVINSFVRGKVRDWLVLLTAPVPGTGTSCLVRTVLTCEGWLSDESELCGNHTEKGLLRMKM